MQQLIINGKNTLKGEIQIGGDKNSAVALIPAALLSDEVVTISNIPNISDIKPLKEILEFLNAKVSRTETSITIDSSGIVNKEIPEGIAKKLRASYYFMGALLSKYKKVEMYFPGGCNIGSRPIDQHLKGFEALGAKITENNNLYTIEAAELIGSRIRIDMPGKGATTSVGATINIMLAAVKAKGKTIIENAAREPQVVNVAIFLNNMGAKISGAGTDEITIDGVEYLKSAFNEVIPDRIEAGTYIILGSLIGDNLKIKNMIPGHVESLLDKLIEAGIKVDVGDDYVVVSSSNKKKAVNIKTTVYPGFVTDLQQPFSTFLTQCEGSSVIEETIYENRFQNIGYLKMMGADIEVDASLPYNGKAFISGQTNLVGTKVEATDLRAGACLVLAGLIASGTTVIDNAEHILRGYENIVSKLQGVGAKIELKEI